MIKYIVDSTENYDVLDSWIKFNDSEKTSDDIIIIEGLKKLDDFIITEELKNQDVFINKTYWYLLIPTNDSGSCYFMEQLKSKLLKFTSHVVRLYPIWGDIQEDHAGLEYWETTHNGNVEQFKKLGNLRALSLYDHQLISDKTSINYTIKIKVPDIKYNNTSLSKEEYLEYVSFLDLVYLDIVANINFNSTLFNLNWINERGFKRSLLSELGMYLLYIGIPTLIKINKDSMSLHILGKLYNKE